MHQNMIQRRSRGQNIYSTSSDGGEAYASFDQSADRCQGAPRHEKPTGGSMREKPPLYQVIKPRLLDIVSKHIRRARRRWSGISARCRPPSVDVEARPCRGAWCGRRQPTSAMGRRRSSDRPLDLLPHVVSKAVPTMLCLLGIRNRIKPSIGEPSPCSAGVS